MRPFPIVTCLAAAALAAPESAAQNLLGYRPAGAASEFLESPAPSPAWSPGPGVQRPPFPAPSRPVSAANLGAVAVDNTNGVIYSTNGRSSIERRVYPRLGCGGGSVLPSLPIPSFVGQVTGMAVDPASKHLFLTDGFTIWELDPPAGMAVVCSWAQSPINVLAGLDFDPGAPGELVGVSTVGEVARYARCGGFLCVRAPSYPWPGVEAVGVTIDKSEAAAPGCSPPPGQVYVLHANGDIYDLVTGAVVHTGVTGHRGLSYVASPIVLPGSASCGGSALRASSSTLAFEGSGGFGIDLCGIPAGTGGAVFLLDTGFSPAPMPPFGVWLTIPFTATVPMAVPAGATSVTLPLPLPAGSAGIGFYVQGAIPCGSVPVLSNALQIEISR